MFRHWLQRQQVRQRLLAFPDGERRLTNLLHLGEVLHQAETERRLGISGLQKWFAEQMAPGEEASEEHQLRLERDDNAVRIVTVHKSKGLEYPVVFCLFSWRDSEIKRGSEEQVFFHDPAQGNKLVRDLGPGNRRGAQGASPPGAPGRKRAPALRRADAGQAPLLLRLGRDQGCRDLGARLAAPSASG